jgi:MoaD family protein
MYNVRAMGKVHVKFLTALQEIATRDSAYIDIEEDETVEKVLDHLCDQFGEEIRKLIFRKNGSVAGNIVIFVNGRNILTLNGLKTRLNDGDYLILSKPVVGG